MPITDEEERQNVLKGARAGAIKDLYKSIYDDTACDEEAMTDLVADIFHWCDQHSDIDFCAILDTASRRHHEEKYGVPTKEGENSECQLIHIIQHLRGKQHSRERCE